jgi:hypothetical protein
MQPGIEFLFHVKRRPQDGQIRGPPRIDRSPVFSVNCGVEVPEIPDRAVEALDRVHQRGIVPILLGLLGQGATHATEIGNPLT